MPLAVIDCHDDTTLLNTFNGDNKCIGLINPTKARIFEGLKVVFTEGC